MTIMCLVWKNYLQIGELSHHRMHHSGFVGQPSKSGQSGTAWEVLDIGYEGIPIYLELSLLELHAFTRWGSILRFTLQGLTKISSLSLWWIAMVSPSMLVGILGTSCHSHESRLLGRFFLDWHVCTYRHAFIGECPCQHDQHDQHEDEIGG